MDGEACTEKIGNPVRGEVYTLAYSSRWETLKFRKMKQHASKQRKPVIEKTLILYCTCLQLNTRRYAYLSFDVTELWNREKLGFRNGTFNHSQIETFMNIYDVFSESSNNVRKGIDGHICWSHNRQLSIIDNRLYQQTSNFTISDCLVL